MPGLGTASCCGNAVSNEVVPAQGKRVVLKLDRAPNDDGPPVPCADDVRGLPVSLRSFLENLHIQGLLGNHQEAILFLPPVKCGRDPIHLRQLQCLYPILCTTQSERVSG